MLERNSIYLGDSYELIKEIPDKSIDLIVIDPPYQIDGKPKSKEALENTKNEITKGINKLNQELMDNHICDGIKEEIFEEFINPENSVPAFAYLFPLTLFVILFQ